MLEAAWCVLGSLAPWLLIGAVVTGALHAFLPRNFIRRSLTGPKGVASAVIMGVPLPLCSCGVIPAGVGLKEDGASDGATVAFMISTPQTGVDSIMVSAAFLGWPFALFKVLSAALTGLVGGWITEATTDADASPGGTTEGDAGRPGLMEGLSHMVTVLRSIWLWVAFGVVASAAITVWVPTESLASVASWGPLGAGLAALALSLPLYVCATASVPIAAAFVAGGLPAGAALVFLMAGPATNVATIGAIHRALGARVLGIYLGTLMVGSLGLGLVFDFVLSGPAMIQAADATAHGCGLYGEVSAVVLLGAIAWFAWEDIRGLWGRYLMKHSEERLVEIDVSGMTCGGCSSRLERVLNAAEDISGATVELTPGKAIVRGGISEARLRELVTGAGFDAGEYRSGDSALQLDGQ